jgi:galactoside O-acetyltransferase
MIPKTLDSVNKKYHSLSMHIYGFLKKSRLKKCGRKFLLGYPAKIFGGNNIEIGDNFSAMGNTYLYGNEGQIKIGNNCGFNTNVQIGSSGGKISIGDNVLLGPNVVLRAADHGTAQGNLIKKQTHVGGEIIIEDDVWVAANAVILKNVRLGKGCVIAAGAVVTKNVEAYAIAAGVPAKKISERTRK